MTTFKDRYGLSGGYSLLSMGPPGTGKSMMLASLAEIVDPDRILALCTKPRERNSWGYRKFGIPNIETVSDAGKWVPELGRYEASGWRALIDRITSLESDPDIDGLLIDTGTDAAHLATNRFLAPEKAETVQDLTDPRGFYSRIFTALESFVQMLNMLTDPDLVEYPKFVGVSWHTQPPKESDLEDLGVTSEGRVMPMLPGSYRSKLPGDFDIVVFNRVERGKKSVKGGKITQPPPEYVVQVQPDDQRHSKVSMLPALDDKTLPNNWEVLHKKILEVGS